MSLRIASLTVLAFSTFAAHGAELIVEAKAVKGNLVIGEPLVVLVKVSNTGSKPATILTELEKEVQVATYEVSRDGHTYKPVESCLVRDPAGKSAVIPVGGHFIHSELLAFDLTSRKLLFPNAGKFFVRVLVQAGADRFVSNPVIIHIAPPASGTETSFSRLISEPDVLALMSGCGGGAVAHEALTQLANRRDSFSGYGTFFILKDTTDADLIKVASAMLDRIERADVPQFPLRPHLIYQRVRIHALLGQSEEAIAQAGRLKQVPDCPTLLLSQAAELVASAQDRHSQSAVTIQSQLESQRYDVRGFLADPPAEFAAAQRRLFEQLERGEVEDADFEKQWQDLLQTSITKLTTPLSEDEWQRRQAMYRAQDEARRAEDYRRAEKLKPLIDELRKKLDAKEITVDEYNNRIMQEQMKLHQQSVVPAPAP
jgi:hypothetical protein